MVVGDGTLVGIWPSELLLSLSQPFFFFWVVPKRFSLTTKKRGYPSALKTAGIGPESAGIGSKFLSRRFFSRRFKPPQFECRYRVAGPVPALSALC